MRTPAPALLAALLAALPAAAHVVSLSSGELRIVGPRGTYELRMPLYEVQHARNPETGLLDQIRFSRAGVPARRVSQSCRPDPGEGVYACSAEYLFDRPPDVIQAECRLHQVTVANHVHLLRVRMDGKADQAVFDYSFPKAEIRFLPPTTLETVARQSGAGFWRVVSGPAQMLFLAALALAARSRREWLALAAAFLACQWAACAVLGAVRWRPAPRFAEAAAALTIAYLSAEILLLPQAGKRWLVAGALGLFHGLYFALFLESSGYGLAAVMAGSTLTQIGLLAGLGWVSARVHGARRVLAGLLLTIGLAWFGLRLRS